MSSVSSRTPVDFLLRIWGMHTADKLEILRSLEAQGVFHTKGSIGQVARELHISDPTVYRYLRRIRSEAT